MTAPDGRGAGSVVDAPIAADEWHGWGWEDDRHPALHVGRRAGRYVLWSEYRKKDNVSIVRVLARFVSEDDAREAMRLIDLLTRLRPEPRP